MRKRVLFVAAIACFFSSCVTVKEYEKVNINDPDMAFASKKSDRYVSTMHAYREAAVGANGGKPEEAVAVIKELSFV